MSRRREPPAELGQARFRVEHPSQRIPVRSDQRVPQAHLRVLAGEIDRALQVGGGSRHIVDVERVDARLERLVRTRGPEQAGQLLQAADASNAVACIRAGEIAGGALPTR